MKNKIKTFITIDYPLYSSLVGMITTLSASFLCLFPTYMNWETAKYTHGKIIILLYFFLVLILINIAVLIKRYLEIDYALNNGKSDKAEVINYLKTKNDCIKLYLKTTERCFVCSFRRSRKNRVILDKAFKEGDLVDIKYYKNTALVTTYYTVY